MSCGEEWKAIVTVFWLYAHFCMSVHGPSLTGEKSEMGSDTG